MERKYKTVAQETTWEVKIRHSVFIGHVTSVNDEEEAKAFIAKVRDEHSQATHNCYAYRIGLNENPIEYYNDHGEPSGTAGRPILSAILQAALTNTVVVVTRYFRGKKLGVRGLIDAYNSTAVQTLTLAGEKIIIPRFPLVISCEYSQLSQINYILEKSEAITESTEYGVSVKLRVSLPEKHRPEVIPTLFSLPGVTVKEPEGP